MRSLMTRTADRCWSSVVSSARTDPTKAAAVDTFVATGIVMRREDRIGFGDRCRASHDWWRPMDRADINGDCADSGGRR